MARKFLVALDLQKNEIQNAVAQVIAGNAASPVLGQFWFNSTADRLVFKSAAGVIDPSARAAHTGTQLALTISDFDSQVRANRLDQLAPPIAAFGLGGNRLKNLGMPTEASDAATMGYVDAAVNGTDWKQSARAATTANLAVLSGLLTIDGITLVDGDRVLVKDQTSGAANGIYVASSGTWIRALDADSNAEVSAGLALMVTEGTLNADSQWRLTTNDRLETGTTALVFAQIGAGSSYSAGSGITITGNTIAIDPLVTVRKFSATFGNGASTSYAVTHGLASQDIVVQVYEVATGSTIECDVTRTSTGQVTLAFASAPASNTLRVVVQG